MEIKGTKGSKEKGRLPLIVVEMGNLSMGQEIPGTVSLMLLIIRNEYILVSSLSVTSPPDTLDVWLIDSGASRHLNGYKEALSDLIKKDNNLEIILGDNAT